MFQQTLNPAGNLWLTVLIAMVPFAALLYMLAALRLTAWLATIIGGIITIVLDHLQYARLHRNFRKIQKMDDPSRHG